ncbi:RNA recognition motif domain containing protein [Hondaea fermentalgiana]|uniref:RNA recognition motif domain containing protein n=1 Tax=Hondaea fermentalgiana TaxID=2315210 RepID=A0A2R5GT06_9STRA|nr:RNA recognition motif domain containing protein [Hondaea fermentalgiana]|eukprot:GBG31014.1 RNA recognition motif domain containing protein [Hondaea fermentalgiana]
MAATTTTTTVTPSGESAGVYARFPKDVKIEEGPLREAMSSFGEVERVNLRAGSAQVIFKEGAEIASKAVEAGKVNVGDAEVGIEALRGRVRSSRKQNGTKKSADQPKQSTEAVAADPRAVYARVSQQEVSKEDVDAIFGKFGKVESIEVAKRKGRSDATHIFVTYEELAGADAVLKASAEDNTNLRLGEETFKVERRKRAPKAKASKKPQAEAAANGDEAPNGGKKKRSSNNKKKDNAEGENGAAAVAENGSRRTKAAPKSSVYVTNMVVSTDEAALKKAFEKFGAIKTASCQQRESFATISFAEESGVEAALAAAKEGKLEIEAKDGEKKRLSASRWRAAGRSGQATGAVENAVHVTGLGFSMPSEDDLKAIFSPLGEISSITVHRTRSFGIVRFEDPAAAAAAVDGGSANLELAPEDPEVPLVIELSDSTKASARNGRNGGRRRFDRRRGPRREQAKENGGETAAAQE